MDAKMHVCNEKIHFYCKIHNLVLNGLSMVHLHSKMAASVLLIYISDCD